MPTLNLIASMLFALNIAAMPITTSPIRPVLTVEPPMLSTAVLYDQPAVLADKHLYFNGIMAPTNPTLTSPLSPRLAVKLKQPTSYSSTYDQDGMLGQHMANNPKQEAIISYNRLGHAHEFGAGLPRDLDIAKQYYAQAAQLGDNNALASLGRLAENENPAMAAKLYQRAKGEHPFAKMRLETLDLDSASNGNALGTRMAKDMEVGTERASKRSKA